MWESFMEVLTIAIKKPDIPPVLKGARGLIQRLCEEEAKIEAKQFLNKAAEKVSVPAETIATIVFKYGNKDIYKDVYQFIK